MTESALPTVGPGQDAAVPAPITRREFVRRIVLVDAVAVFVALLPLLFLGIGIQSLGAQNGWWAGDPNSNDGEEFFATVLGGFGLFSVTVLAAIPVSVLAGRHGFPVWRSVMVSTLGILGSCLILGVTASIF
ncbi:hypothetical protein [Cryobacterium zongtaii]|uniref:hypothetical protein n=1 Tax=Cryobacterium zongtaii TaxID=1259217 RepID=UPI001056E710|nr:hypothetical protein [Cryobacterium zongtaii]